MPMPGNEPKEDKDILPGGPEIVPGEYSFKITLNEQTVEAKAKVLADPRYQVNSSDLKENYLMQRQFVNMNTTLAMAAKKLVTSKVDIKLVKELADKTLELVKDNKEEHPATALNKKADKLLETIESLDKSLRSQPKTVGIVDTSYKVSSKVGIGYYYVASAYGKPSVTAEKYMDLAKASLKKGVEDVNNFLSKDLVEFKAEFQKSGLSLLSQTEPVMIQ